MRWRTVSSVIHAHSLDALWQILLLHYGAGTDESSRDTGSFCGGFGSDLCFDDWMGLHAACFSRHESKAFSSCAEATQLEAE